MRIGELSQRTGVSERLLRYYEEQGLLAPERRPSGYRAYHHDDIATVYRIRSLLAAGLNTALIAQILPCFQDGAPHLVPTCAEMLPDLYRARARMSDAMVDLRSSIETLDAVIAAAPSGDPGSQQGPGRLSMSHGHED
ncbi:MerR family transcriptional regulator [Streptomyces albipurpureus]|uniref:MerR family transcriptional regulator n=1 Tax=Streptomyces albipurpureus TaxID=2897419 RepID=A0ABT0UTJ3_9ACTN|nr:MerR family transcriptional regulator [Streptomyces sp. CWNU-1]MCM2390551.1 MerR family transcriptional regulator [Streptomyces sp. CWNU-1]